MSKIKTLFIVAMAMIMHVAVAQDSQLIKHQAESVVETNGSNYDISEWNAMCLDNILITYMDDDSQPEGKAFYLEGGKAYFINSNITLKKGISLETNPEDLAKGLRATVYMGGIAYERHSCNFLLADDAKKYADPTMQLNIGDITFRGIDFNCPLAVRASDYGYGTGNYFLNMWSRSMDFNLTKLEIDDCSMQGFVRGFFRVQGYGNYNVSNFIINNCVFYNMGPYAANGSSYNWIHFQLRDCPKTNFLNNLKITNNVFYNTAHGTLVNDNGNVPANGFDSSVRWNVNISHNTFVNFFTLSDSYYILRTQSIPGGSTMRLSENLFVLTKDDADVNRQMRCAGWRVDKIDGGDGSGAATFIVHDNYSTNTYLTSGQIWTSYAPSSSNGPGKWAKSNPEWFPKGTDGLVTIADNISPTELMKSPNPPHFQQDALNADAFTCDNIDGLYYNDTEKVKNSEIYKKKIGAPRLFEAKSEPVGIYGDVNGDGVVDIDDVTEVINVICGK